MGAELKNKHDTKLSDTKEEITSATEFNQSEQQGRDESLEIINKEIELDPNNLRFRQQRFVLEVKLDRYEDSLEDIDFILDKLIKSKFNLVPRAFRVDIDAIRKYYQRIANVYYFQSLVFNELDSVVTKYQPTKQYI